MKKRVLTALVLAPIVLGACVVRSPYPIFLIALLATTLGFWEMRTLFKQPKALPVLTLFGLVVPFFGTQIQANRDPVQIILYACIFWIAGLIFALAGARKGSISSAGLDMVGMWVAMPMTCLLMLHRLMPIYSPYPGYQCFLLLILLPLWAGDICGLLVGARFGKHKLAPKLSPKKSWEGAIANLIACVGVAVALMPLLGDRDRLVLHLICGFTIGIVGQIGDLFESWLKRVSGVKDSGSLLPGHGGLLDRIDSLLFAAPVICIILVAAFH